MSKINILQTKIDIAKLKSMIENHSKEITYIVMNTETLDKFLIQTDYLYSLEDHKQQRTPKYSLRGFYSYMGYPIAICNRLEFGEVELV